MARLYTYRTYGPVVEATRVASLCTASTAPSAVLLHAVPLCALPCCAVLQVYYEGDTFHNSMFSIALQQARETITKVR